MKKGKIVYTNTFGRVVITEIFYDNELEEFYFIFYDELFIEHLLDAKRFLKKEVI